MQDLTPVTGHKEISIAPLLSVAQGVLDFAQITIQTGDELMFAVDIPYVPAQETSIVLAQANKRDLTQTAGKQKPDFIIKDCQEFTDHMDSESAEHVIDPAQGLADAKARVRSCITTFALLQD